ncbi:MAG: hypothetical protein WC240_08115 [Bacilli bacterium]|jgi:hypothetical protein
MEKWIIPCNIESYDVMGAFKKLPYVNWKQSTNIEVGDIVYIYSGKPYSQITHKCKAIEINLPNPYVIDKEFVIDNTPYHNYGRYMTLELIKTIENIDLEWLREHGFKGNMQGPRRTDFEW